MPLSDDSTPNRHGDHLCGREGVELQAHTVDQMVERPKIDPKTTLLVNLRRREAVGEAAKDDQLRTSRWRELDSRPRSVRNTLRPPANPGALRQRKCLLLTPIPGQASKDRVFCNAKPLRSLAQSFPGRGESARCSAWSWSATALKRNEIRIRPDLATQGHCGFHHWTTYLPGGLAMHLRKISPCS